MKKTIEKKIIDRVYQYETRKTFVQLFLEVTVTIALISIILIPILALFEIFTEQKTFELLHLFEEDQEVIRKYFWETLSTFYQETPKIILLIIILGLICLVSLLIYIIRHFSYFRNKVVNIIKYWIK